MSLNVPTKIPHPIAVALMERYGEDFFLKAEELNDIVAAIINLKKSKKISLTDNITFTVGVGKDYEDVHMAILEAMRYESAGKHYITILLEEGYVVDEPLQFQHGDFSHIIISSDNLEVLSNASNYFIYNNLSKPPMLFKLKVRNINSATISVCVRYGCCPSVFIQQAEFIDFGRSLVINDSQGIIGNIDIRVEASIPDSSSYMIYALNSSIQVRDANINSTQPIRFGLILQRNSNFSLNNCKVSGEFTFGMQVVASKVYLNQQTEIFSKPPTPELGLDLRQGASCIINSTCPNTFEANIPPNKQTLSGFLYDLRKPMPSVVYSVNGNKADEDGEVTLPPRFNQIIIQESYIVTPEDHDHTIIANVPSENPYSITLNLDDNIEYPAGFVLDIFAIGYYVEWIFDNHLLWNIFYNGKEVSEKRILLNKNHRGKITRIGSTNNLILEGIDLFHYCEITLKYSVYKNHEDSWIIKMGTPNSNIRIECDDPFDYTMILTLDDSTTVSIDIDSKAPTEISRDLTGLEITNATIEAGGKIVLHGLNIVSCVQKVLLDIEAFNVEYIEGMPTNHTQIDFEIPTTCKEI